MQYIQCGCLCLLFAASALAVRERPAIVDELEVDLGRKVKCPESVRAFEAEWESTGARVVQYESIDDFWHGPQGPWTEFQRRKGEATAFDDAAAPDETPRPGPVTLDELMPDAPRSLFHGGDIKLDMFKNGVDFGKAADLLAGPTFYATHNPFLAGVYGWKGADKGGEQCAQDCGCFRQVLQLKIGSPGQCKGLVPSWDVLASLAKLDSTRKKQLLVRELCGGDCDFLAVNWNYGEAVSAKLPYEFRLLPGSLHRCGITPQAILLIPFIKSADNPNVMQEKPFNFFDPRMMKAGLEGLERLLKLGVGMDRVTQDHDAWKDLEPWPLSDGAPKQPTKP